MRGQGATGSSVIIQRVLSACEKGARRGAACRRGGGDGACAARAVRPVRLEQAVEGGSERARADDGHDAALAIDGERQQGQLVVLRARRPLPLRNAPPPHHQHARRRGGAGREGRVMRRGRGYGHGYPRDAAAAAVELRAERSAVRSLQHGRGAQPAARPRTPRATSVRRPAHRRVHRPDARALQPSRHARGRRRNAEEDLLLRCVLLPWGVKKKTHRVIKNYQPGSGQ